MKTYRIPRWTPLLAFLVITGLSLGEPVAAQSDSRALRTRITLRGSELPLGTVLNQISRAAGLALVADQDVRLDRSVPSPNLDDVPLRTALAVVLTPLGYSFETDDQSGQLRVFVYETRTFRVATPAVIQNWSAGVSNTGGTDTGGSSMGARVSLSVQSDTKGLWEELETSMIRLLGKEERAGEKQEDRPDLGTFSINRVAGFVTVRSLPSVMPAIESYFQALNDEMGRTVAIEARVMQVDLNDTTEASLDWTLLAARLGDAAFIGGQAVRSTMINSTAPFLRLSGRAGDAFVRALEEQGKVSVLASPTLALGNNLPAIIELAQVQSYVSQSTTTIAGVGGLSQTTVQTATLSDGLIISMLPRVLSSTGEVSLALGLVLQDVLDVRREEFEGSFVELPRTARRSYNGVVRGRPNETLVIGGLITSRKEKIKFGIPYLSKVPVIGWLFGGVRDIDRHSELVITITPREVRSVAAQPATFRLEPQGMEQ